MGTYRMLDSEDGSSSGYFSKITDSDLRRALLFYLPGLWLYLLFLLLGIGDFVAGMAADPTTPDPQFTPEWIMASIFVASAAVTVFSQIWYLRTKHVWREAENLPEFLQRLIIVEPTVFVWAAVGTTYVTMPSSRPGEGTVTTLLMLSLFVGIPVYGIAIFSWNYKRIIERKFPGISDYSFSASVGLGFVSVIVVGFLPFLITRFVSVFFF